jgi:hypothetical protein
MSIALRSHTPSPQPMILSEGELSCQEISSIAAQPSGKMARAEAPPPALAGERRARFVEHARAAHAVHLCELAVHLPPDEHALILSRYADGHAVPRIAALTGCTKQTIQRRLHRLTRRLLAPEFAFIAPRLSQLDPTSARVARACIVEGHSVRQAAKCLHMSRHVVRETRSVLLGLSRAAGEPPTRPSPIPQRK